MFRLYGMATVMHNTQVKRKFNDCKKSKWRVKTFKMKHQFQPVPVKHAAMLSRLAEKSAYFAKRKIQKSVCHL